MRGKDVNIPAIPFLERITPAYAGKSFTFRTDKRSSWDHPRVCGEKKNYLRYTAYIMGSPPRMRGKVFQRQMEIFG